MLSRHLLISFNLFVILSFFPGTSLWGKELKSAITVNQLGVDMLSTKPEEKSSFHATEVKMNGVPYVRFQSGSTSFFIPKLDRYSANDFDSAFCGNVGTRKLERDASLVRSEIDVTKSFQLYADLVQKTMLSKCNGKTSDERVDLDPQLEMGVSFKPKNSKNENLKYKAFIKSLNQVGVGADF